MHDDEPAVVEYVPASHGVQTELDVARTTVEKYPAWHDEQLDAPTLE